MGPVSLGPSPFSMRFLHHIPQSMRGTHPIAQTKPLASGVNEVRCWMHQERLSAGKTQGLSDRYPLFLTTISLSQMGDGHADARRLSSALCSACAFDLRQTPSSSTPLGMRDQAPSTTKWLPHLLDDVNLTAAFYLLSELSVSVSSTTCPFPDMRTRFKLPVWKMADCG